MIYYYQKVKGMGKMYKLCQTEQSARRQRQMEQALLQLMLRRQYEDISVGDLCSSLQIPRRAFYRYFSGKDGALYALIDHTMMDFFEDAPEKLQHRGSAKNELEQTFAFWRGQKQLLDALARSSLGGILVERATEFTLREGYMPRHFKRLQPEVQSLAMSFSVCGLMSMILRWHKQGFLLSPAEMSALAITLLATPLIPE